MSDYGNHLSNRLKCREIINSLKNELIVSKSVTIDFKGISLMTMSFGTELLDSISSVVDKDSINVLNTNGMVGSVVKFCLNNIKSKQLV